MEWLNDPKNRPVVIGIAVVAVLFALFMGYRTFFGGSGGGEEATVDTTTPPPSTTPTAVPTPGQPVPGQPTPPGVATAPTPGTPAPAAGTAPAAPGTPAQGGKPGTPAAPKLALEQSRNDPFLPFGWKPPKVVKEIIRIPMPERIFQARLSDVDKKKFAEDNQPEPPQPPRRMAGILFNERVYAILERNGQGGPSTMVVKPGDITDDGMRVERIEPNRIVLVSTNGKHRRVDVKMAPSQQQDAAGQAANSGPGSRMPMSDRPGMRPAGSWGVTEGMSPM